MENKFEFVDSNLHEVININKSLHQIYFIDTKSDITLDLTFHQKQSTSTQIIIIVINNNHQVKLEIKCLCQTQKISNFVTVLAYGLEKSNTIIHVTHLLSEEAINCNVKQSIIGLLLSPNALITGIPKLIVNCPDTKAEHSLKISTFDKNEIFYLQTKGIDAKLAQKLLLKSQLMEVLNDADDETKDYCVSKIENRII